MMHKKIKAVAGVMALLCATQGLANVVITGTRIIFPSSEREVSIKLNNEGEAPGLVQAWIDSGDMDATPETATAPFVLTPPVFRVDPKKGQTMRLMYTREPLPQDRESVFWLNLLEVPPKPQEADDSNFLQMAFRTRVKIFYRPAALNSVQKTEDAVNGVTWSIKRAADGKAYVLHADNPSPYFITVTEAGIVAGGNKIGSDESHMLAPGGQHDFPLKSLRELPAGEITVRFLSINDWGSAIEKLVPLAR